MEHHKPKDIFPCAEHTWTQNIMNTLKHIQLMNFKENNYTSKATKDNEKARQIIKKWIRL
jgi:hypothetical protein